jgi:hypothetical protein
MHYYLTAFSRLLALDLGDDFLGCGPPILQRLSRRKSILTDNGAAHHD